MCTLRLLIVALISVVLFASCAGKGSTSHSHAIKTFEASTDTLIRDTPEARAQWELNVDELHKYDEGWHKERTTFLAVLGMFIVAAVIYVVQNKRRTRNQINSEFNRMRAEITTKVRQLEVQKEQLQFTNNRIAESITYALRIQHSIIPDQELLNTYPISESFIFYSPLDIVSGDFYWYTRKDDYLIICCADCTGHGVPGAFMSMIASTIINNVCTHAPGDILPSQILEELDELLRENLAHNTNEEDAAAKDGLDISIASINLKTKMTTIGSARRPVIVFRDQEAITIKGTKRSIGDVEPVIRARKFEDTQLKLNVGDCIYMYSDGYSDQIGGERGEKIKNARILQMLRSIHNDEMDEQSLTMQELFTQWKGDNPQIDDVLLMGIRL